MIMQVNIHQMQVGGRVMWTQDVLSFLHGQDFFVSQSYPKILESIVTNEALSLSRIHLVQYILLFSIPALRNSNMVNASRRERDMIQSQMFLRI
jgi:hypothetical protein